jgi:hypothetical protein
LVLIKKSSVGNRQTGSSDYQFEVMKYSQDRLFGLMNGDNFHI